MCVCVCVYISSLQIHIDQFDQPEPFTSIVNVAICQFTLLSGEAVKSLVERLGSNVVPVVQVLIAKVIFYVVYIQHFQVLFNLFWR